MNVLTASFVWVTFFQKVIQQGYDVNLGLRSVLAQALITEFHFYFKIPTINTKSRKKNSIDSLSEFQWNEIEAKVEIGIGSFGL